MEKVGSTSVPARTRTLSQAVQAEAHKFLDDMTIVDLLQAFKSKTLSDQTLDFVRALEKDLGCKAEYMQMVLACAPDARSIGDELIAKRLVSLQADARKGPQVSSLLRTRELAKIVLATDTIRALLTRSPQYYTVEMREFVDLLVERFSLPVANLSNILGSQLEGLGPHDATTWKALHQIEIEVRGKEPPPEPPTVPPSILFRAITAEAPKYLSKRTIHELLDAHLAGELEGPVSDFMSALCKDFNHPPLNLIQILETPEHERNEKAKLIAKRLVNLQLDARHHVREVDSSEFKESSVPSFLLKGMTVREAFAAVNGDPGVPALLTPEIDKFVNDMLQELGTNADKLEHALSTFTEELTDEELNLLAGFKMFEDRWEYTISKLDRAEVPKPNKVKEPHKLSELEHAKIEAAYWKREAMREALNRVMEGVRKMKAEADQVEERFEILAGSMNIDTTRNFSWDEEGIFTYSDPAKPNPKIRPKGR